MKQNCSALQGHIQQEPGKLNFCTMDEVFKDRLN